MTAITLELRSIVDFTDEQFYQLCQANPDIRLERTDEGELVVMPPAGGGSSKRNADITTDLNIWNRKTRLGVVFDSSGGFSLPNGGDRSPDAAWVKLERWEALTVEEQERFLPLAPDFVIELRSPSDNLKKAQAKMKEYRDNGVRLGWLIEPQNQRVEVYRLGIDVEVLEFPTSLLGEDVLPGFILDLSQILVA